MRIRVKFRKYGVMRFIGHLDIMRYFQKAMRRADIDIAYSEGFSPHQILSFAAPLGVGVISDGEYFDMEVHSTDTTEASVKALNDVMAEGMEITEYVLLPQNTKKCMTAVAAADYIVFFKKQADFTQEELKSVIQTYYTDREEIPVVKQTKKSERTLNLKPLIYALEPWSEGDQSGFFMQLCTGSTDNVKPELVLNDLYRFAGKEYDPFNMQIRRLEVYERTEQGLRPLYQAGEVITEPLHEKVQGQ